MSDQIQNISEEILEYKDKIFVKIFSNALKANKAPFPENVAHYLNKLVMNIGVSPNVVVLSSIRKENNKKIFICDKDGNMIGKSITPTIFVTNNVKLIKASIK